MTEIEWRTGDEYLECSDCECNIGPNEWYCVFNSIKVGEVVCAKCAISHGVNPDKNWKQETCPQPLILKEDRIRHIEQVAEKISRINNLEGGDTFRDIASALEEIAILLRSGRT